MLVKKGVAVRLEPCVRGVIITRRYPLLQTAVISVREYGLCG